jgi:nucleotide-binding universal stress UspA family protein
VAREPSGMAQHVLVPYDDSEQSRGALEHALSQYPEGRLTVLYVIDPSAAAFDAPMTAGPVAAEDWYEDAEADAEALLAEAEAQAQERGRRVETDHTVGRPADAITEYAEEHDLDAIVMGSHGRSGISRVLLGSVAETVVRRAPCPVTVVR